jgi:LuxR family maltose regulon positive regulatory protein
LNDGLAAGHAVTLVSAPAGFGKTTCIREWVRGLAAPAAWLSLEPADDEPARFFTYLIAALQTAEPNLGRKLDGLVRAGPMPSADSLGAALVNDLIEGSPRFF